MQANDRKLPGRLIAVEGLDGSGKSTQIYLIKRWLEMGQHKVFFTEWNSSPLVKKATKNGKKNKLLTPTTFALIHCTDFADRYERQILPLLHAGYIVLADRYIYTAFARDAVRGVDRDWVRRLYSFARTPDLTFFFNVPLNVALNRILEGRPQLKWYEAGMDLGLSLDPYESFRIFQGRIQQEYLKMAEEYGFTTIDASLPPHRQQKEVRRLLGAAIDIEKYRWPVQSPPPTREHPHHVHA
jgi:dTMP kinase